MARFFDISPVAFDFPIRSFAGAIASGQQTGLRVAKTQEEKNQRRRLADIVNQSTVTDEQGNTRVDTTKLVQLGASNPDLLNEVAKIIAGQDARDTQSALASGVSEKGIDYPGMISELSRRGQGQKAYEIAKHKEDIDFRERQIRSMEEKRAKPKTNKVPGRTLQLDIMNHLDADSDFKDLSEDDKKKAAFKVGARVNALLNENPDLDAAQAKDQALNELFGDVKPGKTRTIFGLEAPILGKTRPSLPQAQRLPPGLPEGTIPQEDGTYLLPDGRRVRPKK